jgi:hypothetical protein
MAKQGNKTTIANFYTCSSPALFFRSVYYNLKKQIESLYDLHCNLLGSLLVEQQELHHNKMEWVMNQHLLTISIILKFYDECWVMKNSFSCEKKYQKKIMTLQHKLEEMMYKRNKLEIQELMPRKN